MANKRTKTGFDGFFDRQMKNPNIRAEYRRARREIDLVDELVRALDDARVSVGLSKAELARRISAKPEVVRRLFTTDDPNPTLATFVKLATAVGLGLTLTPRPTTASAKRGAKHQPDASAAT
ncbi:MAG: XRE family transcriptional regulator [Myxococcales bacterium]|nr:XRE family transcriptional regulator [Myxococcales bacterium]